MQQNLKYFKSKAGQNILPPLEEPGAVASREAVVLIKILVRTSIEDLPTIDETLTTRLRSILGFGVFERVDFSFFYTLLLQFSHLFFSVARQAF